jgi:hypothetical protein
LSNILGQVQAGPLVGRDWTEAKAWWFQNVLGYRLYAQEVLDFHASEAPTRIVSAPARTSKSMSTAADGFVYGMPSEPLTSFLGWVIGPTYEVNKEFQYLWEWLVDGREKHGLPIEKARNNPGNGDCIITLDYGWNKEKTHRCRATWRGMSSTNERALQGEEVSWACLSEAAEHPQHIYTKYLQTRCWKIVMPTTPKPYAEWIHEMVELGETDPSLGIEHFHYPRHANPTYNEARFEQAKRKAELRSPTGKAEDDPLFAEQFLGLWVYYTGMVLPFNEARHVLDNPPAEVWQSRKFVSLDYGYEDAAVALFWAVLPSGILVIFDEIYEKRLSTPAFVDRIQERMSEYEDTVSYIVGDPSKPEVARIMRDAGLNVFDVDKNAMRARDAGFTRLRDVLAEGPLEGFPGLYVTRDCPKTIAEWKHLRFKENCRNEFANGSLIGADHAADAARYGVMTRPTPQPMAEGGDWLKAHEQRVRRRRFGRYGKLGGLGLSGWAERGVSPYA